MPAALTISLWQFASKAILNAQVGRYGGLEEEVEHLKRDKNVLMLELVRLRQQQQVHFVSSTQQLTCSAEL